ncbi:MAG: HAMP domain-containing histidine kinase [Clostridia bacterium]|nr:HAMP domain-containing histidine kinase [Clostridia bacterium]
MAQKKNASFATILMLILIVSTVIVFTVLLFLSYENIINSTYEESQNEVVENCHALASSSAIIIDGDKDFSFGEDEYKTRIIVNIIANKVNAEGGSAYVVDSDGTVKYYINPIDNLSIDIKSIKTYGHSFESVSLDENRTIITSVEQIGEADSYIVYSDIYDRHSAVMEFNSIIMYPAIIAVTIAIVLFVFGIQITLTPVREMTRVFGKLAEGDYSVRVDEKYTKYKEGHLTSAAGDIVTMGNVVNDMISKLENQENDRQIFISSVAHDIRTPLTSINGFVTAIMDGTIPPEKQDHYLGLIKQELNRIKKLVVTMTEASSLSHVDPEVMESFNVEDVITDIVDNLEPQLSEKSIKAEVRFDNSPKAKMCYGEAQQLCRVVVNIINNAIKFTPVDGRIIVSTKAVSDEKKVLISVEDSGIGIPPEKRSRVFESFYKVDTSRTHEGFGLGLYICKQILAGHGQTIYLDDGNELGGAKFVFSFPMPPEDK